MIKPTPEQITEYAKSIGFALDGDEFVDHYEANGWCVRPRMAMASWKATVRNWKRMRTKWSKQNGNEYSTEDAGQDDFELLRKLGC
jgi:hypothetical protein